MGKREDIIEATIDLIVEEGLPSFSFSKLLARASVGAGTVYNYFPGKETLINTVYQAVTEEMDRETLRGYDRTAPFEDRFFTLMKGLAAFAQSYPKYLAFLDACAHSPSVSEELRHKATPSMIAAIELFVEGQRAGVLAPLEPGVALQLSTGALMAVIRGGYAGKYRIDDSVLDKVMECCWRALTL